MNAFLSAGFKKILLNLVYGHEVVFTDILAPKKDALKLLLGQVIIFLALFCVMIVLALSLSLLIPLGISTLLGQFIVFFVLQFLFLYLILFNK